MGNKKNPDRIEEIIRKTVVAAVTAAQRAPNDIYKATEKRLYALPYLKQRILDEKELYEEFLRYGPRQRDKSITRFVKSGSRLDPQEIYDAVKLDMEATLASDEYEAELVEKAYTSIEGDQYAYCVQGRYFEDLDDESIAEAIGCDTTTVWRNRRRLVQRIAVMLYGAGAVR